MPSATPSTAASSPPQLHFCSSDVLFFEALEVARRRDRTLFARGLWAARLAAQVEALKHAATVEQRMDDQQPQLDDLAAALAWAEQHVPLPAPRSIRAVDDSLPDVASVILRAQELIAAFRAHLVDSAGTPLPPETIEQIDRELENRHRRAMLLGQGESADSAPPLKANVQLHTMHPDALVGLALSGGGIRSASYALGALESMAKENLLSCFDMISSVSGGGYAGSWVTAWAYRHAQGIHGVELDIQPGNGQTSGPLRWVRRHCAYLAPRLGSPMSSDMWALIVAYLWNWLPVLMLISSALLTVLLLPHSLVASGQWLSAQERIDDPDLQWSAAVLGALLFMLLGGLLRRLTLYRRVPGRLFRFPHLLPELIFYATMFVTVCWALAMPLFWPLLLKASQLAVGSVGAGELICMLVVVSALSLGSHLIAFVLTLPPVLAFFDAVRNFGRKRPILPGGDAVLWTGMPLPLLLAGAATTIFVTAILVVVATSAVKVHRPSSELVVTLGPLLMVLGLAVAELSGQVWLHSAQPDRDRAWAARVGGWMLSAVAAWAGLCLLAFGARALDRELTGLGSVGLFIVALGVAGWLTWRRFGTAGVAGLVVIVGFVWLVVGLALQPLLAFIGRDAPLRTWAALLVAFCVTGLLAGIAHVNRFSLHALYKEGLVRTFLGASRLAPRNRGVAPPAGPAADAEQARQFAPRRQDPVTNIDLDDDPQLGWLLGQPGREVPLLLLNAAVNGRSLTDIEGRVPRQFPFTFSALFTGSPAAGVGYARTTDYRDGKARPTLSLGTAMAVSGAAMSPTSGRSTHPVRALILGILNARLGVWIGNPEDPTAVAAERPRLAGLTVLREMLGVRSRFGSWIHLSDGGHFENLGVYELVRRGCRRIVAVDASCDPERSFSDLAEAIRRVRIDLNIRIEGSSGWMTAAAGGTPQPPPAAVRRPYSDAGPDEPASDKPAVPAASGATPPSAAAPCWMWFTIDYGDDLPLGRLLYVKPSVDSGPDTTAEVRNYWKNHAAFPHETTADQFFGEAQMECYRQLGHDNMKLALKMPLTAVGPGEAAGKDQDPNGLFAVRERENKRFAQRQMVAADPADAALARAAVEPT